MSLGRLIVFSGPSGSGKSTVVSRLCEKHQKVRPSISATTRKARGEEKDGVHYFFYEEKDFLEAVKSGKFLEYAQVHSRYYGTPREWIENELKKGTWVLLDIDVQGAMQIKAQMEDAFLVFIQPPSLEILRQRLEGRSTDSNQSINERMAVAEMEMSYARRYDVTLINDNLEHTMQEIEKILPSGIDC